MQSTHASRGGSRCSRRSCEWSPVEPVTREAQQRVSQTHFCHLCLRASFILARAFSLRDEPRREVHLAGAPSASSSNMNFYFYRSASGALTRNQIETIIEPQPASQRRWAELQPPMRLESNGQAVLPTGSQWATSIGVKYAQARSHHRSRVTTPPHLQTPPHPK